MDSDQLGGDITAVISSIGILFASYHTFGWGGALALAGINVLIYGSIRELKSENSRISRLFRATTPSRIRDHISISWVFLASGLILLAAGLTSWGLGFLEIHTVRTPIVRDHLTFLDMSDRMDLERPLTVNNVAAMQDLVQAQHEQLLARLANGFRQRNQRLTFRAKKEDGKDEVKPLAVRSYRLRSVELQKRYLPFELELPVVRGHRFVDAYAVIAKKHPHYNAFTQLSIIPVEVTASANINLRRTPSHRDILHVDVADPPLHCQIVLFASVARTDAPDTHPSERFDEVFQHSRFLIR